MAPNQRRRFITLLGALAGGGLLLNACGDNIPAMGMGTSGNNADSSANTGEVASVNLQDRGPAPEFQPANWVNSEPIKLADLRGQPVLLEFWTFGCINCQNVLPSLKSWYDEFSGKGLAFVSFHRPEFDYEKKLENVQQAIQNLGIKYPVAQDNDSKTWDKYSVRGWPTLFLIDRKGHIRFTQFGEGAYDQIHTGIQMLLAEQA
ncbi:MAG: redoxin domain-containing protein [Chloroflexi bacterium]|nr:redoxin domain-containing protein [Chloroflexota bacterium]